MYFLAGLVVGLLVGFTIKTVMNIEKLTRKSAGVIYYNVYFQAEGSAVAVLKCHPDHSTKEYNGNAVVMRGRNYGTPERLMTTFKTTIPNDGYIEYIAIDGYFYEVLTQEGLIIKKIENMLGIKKSAFFGKLFGYVD